MPLFLITSVCDEGVSATSFKIVEAESRLAIAQHILDHPHDPPQRNLGESAEGGEWKLSRLLVQPPSESNRTSDLPADEDTRRRGNGAAKAAR